MFFGQGAGDAGKMACRRRREAKPLVQEGSVLFGRGQARNHVQAAFARDDDLTVGDPFRLGVESDADTLASPAVTRVFPQPNIRLPESLI